MTTKTKDIQADPQEIIDLVVAMHREGAFVRDASPSVLLRNDKGELDIRASDREQRRHRDDAALALGELWTLMRGESPRVKIESASDYCRRRGLAVQDIERLLRDFRREDVERCFHENRDFVIFDSGPLVWHARRELLDERHRPILDDPDAFLNAGSKLIKSGRATTIAMTPGTSLLKRFNLKYKRNLLFHEITGSRARRAFQRAYHLETMGIRTARAIAFAERRRFGLLSASYVLFEFVDSVQPGAQAFQSWNGSRPQLKQRVLEQAGRVIGRLHDAGFSNRDLKSSNILVNDEGEVWVIDLDGVNHHSEVPEEQRLRNLRRIVRDLPRYGELTKKEALIFLGAYARAVRSGDARSLFRRLSQPDE